MLKIFQHQSPLYEMGYFIITHITVDNWGYLCDSFAKHLILNVFKKEDFFLKHYICTISRYNLTLIFTVNSNVYL